MFMSDSVPNEKVIAVINKLILLGAEETSPPPPPAYFFPKIFHPGHFLPTRLSPLREIFSRIFAKKGNSLSLKYFEVSFHCLCIKLFFSSSQENIYTI